MEYERKRKIIAENLKAHREDLNLSQTQLAIETGLSQQTISRWEAGIHVPNALDCITLAIYFNVSLDELLGLDYIKLEEEKP